MVQCYLVTTEYMQSDGSIIYSIRIGSHLILSNHMIIIIVKIIDSISFLNRDLIINNISYFCLEIYLSPIQNTNSLVYDSNYYTATVLEDNP
jgi:hypothetical protein